MSEENKQKDEDGVNNFPSLNDLFDIRMGCSEVEGNINFNFNSFSYEKNPPSIENLLPLAEPMIESCLIIMENLMGNPKYKATRGRFHLQGKKYEYELILNTDGIQAKHKTWNSYTVALFYRNLIRGIGIEKDYVDLYFSPERLTHWGRRQEPDIDRAECLEQFTELEESINPHIGKLASMVMGESQ